ncbi:MAG TPA: hypothetical protein VD839_03805 [Burkholderiales bacterium]|nr:hypothetical protein [Burkholderiales bacterium]
MKRLFALALALAAATAFARGEMPPSIQEVKARHEARLMEKPGVVAVGLGRDTDGRQAIIVSLDRERPDTRAAMPEQLEGYAVRVQVIGPVRAK